MTFTITYFNSPPKGHNPWDLHGCPVVSSFSRTCLYHDENWMDHLACMLFQDISWFFLPSKDIIWGELPHILSPTQILCFSGIPGSLTGDGSRNISYFLENGADCQLEWNLVAMGVCGVRWRLEMETECPSPGTAVDP